MMELMSIEEKWMTMKQNAKCNSKVQGTQLIAKTV